MRNSYAYLASFARLRRPPCSERPLIFGGEHAVLDAMYQRRRRQTSSIQNLFPLLEVLVHSGQDHRAVIDLLVIQGDRALYHVSAAARLRQVFDVDVDMSKESVVSGLSK